MDFDTTKVFLSHLKTSHIIDSFFFLDLWHTINNMIIDLLKRKNTYLNRFSRLSACECKRLKGGDFSRIQRFYRLRKTLLKAIETIDRKIAQCRPQKAPSHKKQEILELLKKQRSLGLSILQKDLCIHCYIHERSQKSGGVKSKSA